MADKKQIIISLGREFGSGGHEIADKLAATFNLPLYDHNLLREIADHNAHKRFDFKRLEKYDELPKKKFFSRRVKGFSNSNEENIAQMQFDFIREKAGKGESFIVVGRCAETVLKGNKALVSIFINADHEDKIQRVSKRHNISRAEAETLIRRRNIKRKHYHNYYCDSKWGDSRNYDISVNSTRLGMEKTIELLIYFINERLHTRENQK
ncbi:MAG: cytidylate kinase-like family protein [Clostridiales bacterium]|nr:cytidylate kinase-like family protein [Clostridiales bacterium]